jgi:hypothetical protein
VLVLDLIHVNEKTLLIPAEVAVAGLAEECRASVLRSWLPS